METAEYVSPMHPDKLCDRISDTILDNCLTNDPNTRAAIEVMGGHGKVVVMGELTSTHKPNIDMIVRCCLPDDQRETTEVEVRIVEQSPEIAQGVDNGGAGDQGVMIGYANRNAHGLPQALRCAKVLNSHLFNLKQQDGKTQITLDEHGNVDTVVASWCDFPTEQLREAVERFVKSVMPTTTMTRYLINPAGEWKIGGFNADTGLTGRKLAVDNYGPSVPIGGGAFSGKDATKVDRSAAYMARHLAVRFLEHHPQGKDAEAVIIRMAYAIGHDQPVEVSADVQERGNYRTRVNLLGDPMLDGYDLSPAGIIKALDLKKPQYERLAIVGHFGTDNLWDKPEL